MDKIEEFTLQQVIDNQERVIKEQKEDIERLQAQLDREIHINRIMKKTLEEYANEDNWEYYNLDSSDECLIGEYQNCEFNEVGFEPAQQTLKQIEEME